MIFNRSQIYLSLISIFSIILVNCEPNLTRYPCSEYCRHKIDGVRYNKNNIRSIRVRKDVKCLTEEEWNRFHYAVNKVHQKGIFDKFSRIHDRYFASVHDKSEFLPWHRWLLFMMETELQNVDPDVTLPYWDAGVDGEFPERSIVLTPNRFGTNGDPNDNHCVKDGISAGWIRNFPKKRCLRRQYMPRGNHKISPWHSPEFITHILQTAETFDNFRINVEFSIHPFVHNNLGDRNGDLNNKWSANDPLFYMIHANADRIWAKWQLAEKRNYYDYSGPWLDRSNFISYYTANLDKNLTYFDVPVRSAFKFGFSGMPFIYDEFLNDAIEPLESESSKRLIGTLPKDSLRKWFPKFAGGTANRYYVDLPPSCSPRGIIRDKRELYYSQDEKEVLAGHLNKNEGREEEEEDNENEDGTIIKMNNGNEEDNEADEDEVLRTHPKFKIDWDKRMKFDGDDALINGTLIHRMVLPTQFDYQALIARGFDPWRIYQVEMDSNYFVSAMNQLNYNTPY